MSAPRPGDTAGSRAATAVLRLLLRLYPAAFHTRYAREMEQLFRASYAERARSRGAGGLLVLCAHTLADVAITAVRERAAALAEWRRARSDARSHTHTDDRFTQGEGMSTLLQDLRYAVRTLRKSPGFALVVIVSLALGIGANSLIYSVVDGIIFRPFPYPDADRLMSIGVTYPKASGERQFIEAISPPEYNDLRAGTKTLERYFAFDLGNRNISGGDQPERLFTGFIWGDPMATIGVRPALGRGFRMEETTTRGPNVAVISHRIWQSRFGGDSAIIGRTVRVNGEQTEVVGVMPPGFLLFGTDLWLPMGVDPAEIPRNRRQWTVIARLRDGATGTEANAELAAFAGRIEREYARELPEYTGWRVEAEPWADAVVGEMRPAATMLLGAVGLVLLIACANIASLMLARAAARQREIAVRRALGAGRGRIARQLLTESVLLALLGASVGLALAFTLLGPTSSLFPEQLRMMGVATTINGHVLLYTLGAAVVSGLVFGVAPVLQGLRGHARDWLTGDGGGGRLTTSATGRRLRNGFVVFEIALSLMLLVGAGVLIRSFARLQSIDPGFDTGGVLTMRLSLAREKYDQEEIAPFFEELSRRLAALPGVSAAAATTQFPPGNVFTSPIRIEGNVQTGEQPPRVDVTNATESYLGAMGYSLAAGRFFTPGDNERAPRVAVINEAAARRFFAGQNPIGQRFALGQSDTLQWIEIVGVARDVRNRGLHVAAAPEVFIPVRQQNAAWNNQLFLMVRAQGDPLTLLPAVRRTVASLDADQPVYSIRTLDTAFGEAVATRRAAMLLVSIFAGVALVLAAVGVYGLMSHMVSERTHEFGIRMALGAASGDVLRLVVRQTVRLVVVGTVIGLLGALALGRVLTTLVFEVRPTDPATLAGVSALLAAVAFAACLIPARRATRVTPIVALRNE